jgi:hypothetical protein
MIFGPRQVCDMSRFSPDSDRGTDIMDIFERARRRRSASRRTYGLPFLLRRGSSFIAFKKAGY